MDKLIMGFRIFFKGLCVVVHCYENVQKLTMGFYLLSIIEFSNNHTKR